MRQGKVLAGTVLVLSLCAASASAQEKGAEKKNPWRGSSISYQQAVSAISLNKSAEQTWNPYYAHGFALQPQWHFGDLVTARAEIGFEQELTNSDWTPKQRQWLWSDLVLGASVGGPKLEVPASGIRLSAGLMVQLPLSKPSDASSLRFALVPSFNASRRFDVLKGLTLRYGVGPTFNFHRYTTVQYDAPGINCGDAARPECSSFLHEGERNVSWALAHGPTIELVPFEKLEVAASYRFARMRLYDNSDVEVPLPTGALVVDDGEDVPVRYAQVFSLEVGYQALDQLRVALGVLTRHPDLRPDGKLRAPFFNRYTQFYLDLTIDADSVVALF